MATRMTRQNDSPDLGHLLIEKYDPGSQTCGIFLIQLPKHLQTTKEDLAL